MNTRHQLQCAMAGAAFLTAPYFCQDKTLGSDAHDERVLTVGKLARAIRALPCEIFFQEVDMVECAVVKLGIRDQRRVVQVVARICFVRMHNK